MAYLAYVLDCRVFKEDILLESLIYFKLCTVNRGRSSSEYDCMSVKKYFLLKEPALPLF